jgi:hypothetical protein
MIIQSVTSVNDMVNHQYRTTFYKTLEDPVSRKQYIEVVQYLYNKIGQLERNGLENRRILTCSVSSNLTASTKNISLM